MRRRAFSVFFCAGKSTENQAFAAVREISRKKFHLFLKCYQTVTLWVYNRHIDIQAPYMQQTGGISVQKAAGKRP
jgi:hypothetical protein